MRTSRIRDKGQNEPKKLGKGSGRRGSAQVLATSESFDFLGYTFGPERYRKAGHWYLGAKPSKKSVQRIKGKVRRILRPGNQGARGVVVARVNRLLRGWANYYSYGRRLMAYRAIDQYVYRAV